MSIHPDPAANLVWTVAAAIAAERHGTAPQVQDIRSAEAATIAALHELAQRTPPRTGDELAALAERISGSRTDPGAKTPDRRRPAPDSLALFDPSGA